MRFIGFTGCEYFITKVIEGELEGLYCLENKATGKGVSNMDLEKLMEYVYDTNRCLGF